MSSGQGQGQGPATSLADVVKSFGDLVGQGVKLGTDVAGLVRLPARSCGCGCEIPAPCWAPQPVGDVASRVCPGSQAVVRIHVTNCGRPARRFHTEATDPAIAIEPAVIDVGPMERTTIVASLAIPADATEGARRDVILWINGCKEYFLRWSISVTCSNTSCCTDVSVDDCPDLIHHWYDHFYCERGCRGH
jgi:hypothetical protein